MKSFPSRKNNAISIVLFLLLLSTISLLGFSPSVRQHRSQNQRGFDVVKLNLFSEPSSQHNQEKIPFIIEPLHGRSPKNTVFDEIAEMCITVFFNDDKPRDRNIAPWRALQLGYLRNIQTVDLRQRSTRSKIRNDMFVARRLIPIPASTIPSEPLVLDFSDTYNAQEVYGNGNTEFVRGEVLGFCEVSEKPFGLGEPYDTARAHGRGVNGFNKMRPVLTNLSVKAEARGSGIGAQLVEACENSVVSWDATTRGASQNEIILEVEDDNPAARQFYEKRGYQVLFADPASRRYDTSGFILKRVRSTKICMRKCLELKRVQQAGEQVKASLMGDNSVGSNLFQRLRETVFQK